MKNKVWLWLVATVLVFIGIFFYYKKQVGISLPVGYVEKNSHSEGTELAPNTKWVGLRFSSDIEGVKFIESFSVNESKNLGIFVVETKTGREVWSVRDEGNPVPYIILDVIPSPDPESSLMLVVYDCRYKNENKMESSIVALVKEKEYMSPTLIFFEPKEVWKLNSTTGKFENASTSNLVCASDEGDSY
jgi:hypothetical protein